MRASETHALPIPALDTPPHDKATGPSLIGRWDSRQPAGSSALRLSETDVGLKEIEGPGLRIRLDPRRVGCLIADDSVTLWMGPIGASPQALNQSAAAARSKIVRGDNIDVSSLRGRFALVHLDLRGGTAVMAIDRFGVYPLCYSARDGHVAFSDRADGVSFGAAPQVDLQALYNFVYFHVIPAPRTVFRDVVRVEAAQVVRASARGVSAELWWQPAFRVEHSMPLADLKVSFRDVIKRAVEREMTGRPIGSYLSGGTDSSTITGVLREITGVPNHAFSIGFDAAGYDEMSYARIAAKRYGAIHHEYYITPDDLIRSVPRVARHYDQPFGNSSALPAFCCGLEAQRFGMEKMLAGDGGDELFGGNLRYAKQKVFAAYGIVPEPVRSALIEPLLLRKFARRVPLLKKVGSYVEQARVPMPDRMETYNLLDRFGAASVFTPALLARVDSAEPRNLQREVYRRIRTPSVVDRMLAYDWRFTLADNDLPKVVGTAQLAGLEVGFPFLDDDVVDFSTALAPELKVRGLTLRYFFKEALRGFLPDEIIRKSKHGFGLPFGPWLERSTELRYFARSSLEELAERGLIQRTLVVELFSQRLREHAGYFGEMIWILMMLEHWLKAHSPGFRIE